MNKRIFVLLVLSWSILSLPVSQATTSPHTPIIAAYYPDWKIYNKQKLTPSKLAADKLTHLIYAFLAVCGPVESSPANIQKLLAKQCHNKPVGTVVLLDEYAAIQAKLKGETSSAVNYKGNFGQLKYLSEQYPDLVILPSIGGWTLSEPFHTIVLSPEYRSNFANSVRELLESYPFFKGIQIDWEYPGGHGLSGLGLNNQDPEKQGFTDLLKAVREQLDELEIKYQQHYELSAAISASPKHDGTIDWQQVSPLLDYLYVMTFDFLGAWSNVAGHHANLYTTSTTPDGNSVAAHIKSLLNQGIANHQLVIGTPFYGRIWKGVEGFSSTNFEGLHTTGASTKGSDGASGIFNYSDIARHFLSRKKLGYQYFYDEKSEAAVLYHPKNQEYISFEDPRSLKAKATFVTDNALGGMFAWEATADHQHQMLDAMHEGLLKNEQ
ncbi:glycoside hydrolase family 18 protein [Photobacterium minamisatsumaniensis]|uniref:glycoside hydrolase family 18 protein n=1 Tax=Photobacterium minamisatsumaniensis TaxID=2910233 RepID=UPI003D128CF0